MISTLYTLGTRTSMTSDSTYDPDDPYFEPGDDEISPTHSDHILAKPNRGASLDRPMPFMRISKKLQGRNVKVADNCLSASRSPDSWSHAIVCATEGDPLIPGRSCLIRIQQQGRNKPQGLVGGLNIAVVDDFDRLCKPSPSNESPELPPFLCPDLEKHLQTGIWSESISNDLLSDGCRLWICYGYDGCVHHFINNNYCGRLFSHYCDTNPNGQYVSIAQHFIRKSSFAQQQSKSPRSRWPQLWLLFDLYGSTTGVELLAMADDVTSPNEVFVGGRESIQSYAAACQSGVVPESDAPIVFLGPTDSGKSTVCQSLVTGQSLSPALLEGTPFAAKGGGLIKFEERNHELTANVLSGSLNLQDNEQWYGAYMCSESIQQRPRLKSKSQSAFFNTPKTSDHLLRMSVSAAQNLVLQGLSKYDSAKCCVPDSPIEKSTPIIGDITIVEPTTPRLSSYLPPNVVASTPNDLLLLAQTMFDEIVNAEDGGAIVPHRSTSRASSISSNVRRRAGYGALSYRLCDLATKLPACQWLSPIILLPKATYVLTFDLTRIELPSSGSPVQTSNYLDELSTWLELIYLRHSETNHFSPWSAQLDGDAKDDDEIFDQSHVYDPCLPCVLLVGTRSDSLASPQVAETLRSITSKLKYVSDWLSGRPYFKHVVGVTAYVPTMVLAPAVASSVAVMAPIVTASTVPSICGISQLRKILESIARQQPTNKNFIPQRWLDLEGVITDLAAGGLTFLTTEQLRTLATDAQVASDSELVAYVRYAHSMGRLYCATVSSGATGHIPDHSISDSIVFVNPHSLATVIANSLVSLLKKHEQESETSPPLTSEDSLYSIFQIQQAALAEQRSHNSNNSNDLQSDSISRHRQLRWVSWLLNKLDIATPWILRPNENPLNRKFVLLPLVPNKLSARDSCSSPIDPFGMPSSTGTSPLFTFYVEFKSTASEFLYQLFLCRCLRWVVSRVTQMQQQHMNNNTIPTFGSVRHHAGPQTGAANSMTDSEVNEPSRVNWLHQLSQTVSYIRIDDRELQALTNESDSPEGGASSSLVIIIANQIPQYNRIKVTVRGISGKTIEEPLSPGNRTPRSESDHYDLHRTYSDSQTLAADGAESSNPVNQQAMLYVLNDLRKCVLRAFGDLQTAMFHRLSFQLSVACPCLSTKCSLHDQLHCSQETCVHLISLSECLANSSVTCELDGRTNTAPIRAWFPSVVMPACPVAEEPNNKSPILIESVIVDTFDNIELHKGSIIPAWLKSAAKLLNIEYPVDDNDEEDDSDSETGDTKGWAELTKLLGYNETALQRFGEDLNPSLALLCDWIVTAGNDHLAIDVLLSYLEQMGRSDVINPIRNGRRLPKSVQVFVSYQYDTQADVRALCEWLQMRGYTYWLDDAQMSAGDQLAVEIERAIRNCRVFLACLSPRYLVSQHCHREIWLADLLNKPIVPIVFEKIPWPPPGPLGLVLARLVYVDMKGIGGHGGGGLEADFLGRLGQVVDIVAGYMPHSASPNARIHPRAGILNVLRSRNQHSTIPPSATSVGTRSLIGTDHGTTPGSAGVAVRVQSCTGCSVM